jgi:hypothetical protein
MNCCIPHRFLSPPRTSNSWPFSRVVAQSSRRLSASEDSQSRSQDFRRALEGLRITSTPASLIFAERMRK